MYIDYNGLARVAFFGIAGISVSIYVKKLYNAIYCQDCDRNDDSNDTLLVQNAPPMIERTAMSVVRKVSSIAQFALGSPGRTLSLSVLSSALIDPGSVHEQSATHWFQTVDYSDDYLHYIILLNDQCGLSNAEFEEHIRRMSRHVDGMMETFDAAKLREWRQVRASKWNVPNEACLAAVHGRARSQGMLRCLLTNHAYDNSLVMLGLGPATVQEIHRVLDDDVVRMMI